MNKKTVFFLSAAIICLAIFWWGTVAARKRAPAPPATELVMSEGETIVATTKEGTIEISAGRGLEREYRWDGAARSLELIPRVEKWYGLGLLGGYNPGTGEQWLEHQDNGITRGVVDEGHIKFASEKRFQNWLKSEDWRHLQIVYRNDGLAVGWFKNYPRRQLDVVVFQVLIGGKKPAHLDGASDDKVKLYAPTTGVGQAKP